MMQGKSHNNSITDNKRGSIQHIAKELKIELFNYLDWLAAGHNVTASNTMIKITYNKGMKDHSATSVSGNDCERKRHSVVYEQSYSDNYNHTVPISDKNYRKTFDRILFIPDNIKVNKNNGARITKNIISKQHSKVIAKEKIHVTSNRSSFGQDLDSIMNTGNHFKNFEEHHQLKELRVVLPKKSVDEYKKTLNPSISASQLQGDLNVITGDLVEKKFLEIDTFKNQNENKEVVSSGNLKIKIKKDKIKPSMFDNKEKERLKLLKNDNDSFKRRSEDSMKVKKIKTESDISGKQIKEKRNITKGKMKEKKVVGNKREKKASNKTINDSYDFKDSSKKELLREDPTLPPGWRRIIKGKHVGSELRPVVCIASPEGRKFYFKARLKEYLEKTNSHLTINDFYFGLYERNEKDREENRSSNSDKGKIISKMPKKKRGSENYIQEQESKRMRLDNSSGFKDAHEQFLALNDPAYKLKGNHPSGERDSETGNNNLLLVDPDLPAGWVRKVRVKNDPEGRNKIQVWIISPEGKKFRRKYLLQKYLLKIRSPLDINQFYFGLYPRRDRTSNSPTMDQNKGSMKHQSKMKHSTKKVKKSEASRTRVKEDENSNEYPEFMKKKQMSLILTKIDGSLNIGGEEPLLDDPNLPFGWRRCIKVRSTGESAGRMEVIISSPDGKRHRSKGSLEHYIKQKGLDLKADDFDFTVFGKNSRRYSSAPVTSTPKQKPEGASFKKRNSLFLPSDSSFRSLSLNNSFGESKSREALMINYVSAIMLNCGLRDLRSERRIRIPKEEQEKILKNYLDSETVDGGNEKNDISISWVQRLIHCRSDFGKLDVDAAATIASLTKGFLLRLTQNALKVSKNESNLEYSDLAELVDKYDSLSPLKTLIPKKITFREFMKLNRPKKFTSFT